VSYETEGDLRILGESQVPLRDPHGDAYCFQYAGAAFREQMCRNFSGAICFRENLVGSVSHAVVWENRGLSSLFYQKLVSIKKTMNTLKSSGEMAVTLSPLPHFIVVDSFSFATQS
jgi:hypothetical protein